MPSPFGWRLALPLAFVLSGLAACSTAPDKQAAETTTAAISPQQATLEGRLRLNSRNGKTLTVETGAPGEIKLVTVRYDEKSKGIDQMVNGYAVVVNYEIRSDGMPYVTEARAKLATLPAGVTEIKTAELKSLIESGAPVTLIDSRPADRHAQGHLPGALSLPEAVLKEKGAAALPSDKARTLIFYCTDPGCTQSTNSAALARAAGYASVRVYLEGIAAWDKAGLPLHASHQFIAAGDNIVIDLRETKKAEAGRIPRAISIPAGAAFEKALDALPKKAAYVLYGEDEKQALAAMNSMKAEGFRRVALVPRGLEGWLAQGGALAQGAVATQPQWQRKPAKHEVSWGEFQKALAGEDPNAVIIDVRASHELKSGKLPQAISLPMDELEQKISLLPRQKKIYAICPTGTRGEIVAGELRKKGFEAYFLSADVECKGDKCSFSNF